MEILTFGIAGLCVLLCALGALDLIAGKWGFPLPILAAMAGLTAGFLVIAIDPVGRNWLLDSYDLWFLASLGLSPQSVVTLLLPPLLFELTLGVDVRKLRQDTVIVGVMAVIAVIVATGVVGIALVTMTDFPLLACLLLGATISTTDPAAVVAIFRRIGAPRRLLIVLEGESLLNDAAAIALFVLFLAMLRQEIVPTFEGIVAAFIYLFAAGSATGIISGWLISRCLGYLRGNYLAQGSLGLATAYGVYLIAEYAFHASGVVAVVAAGLTITVSGASRVPSEDWQATIVVWMQHGYWANGLIIMLAAGLSPALLMQLTFPDLALVVLVVIAAFAARAFILFGLLPLLDYIGLSSPMTGRQKTLIWWGGIRGAVTLLLALSLSTISALPDGLGVKLAGVGVAFVFVTLFLNGSTLALMTSALGLNRLSSSDQALRNELVMRTIHRGIDHVDELGREHGLDEKTLSPVKDALNSRLQSHIACKTIDEVSFGDRLKTGLTLISNQERRIVRQHYDEGIIGRETMRNLQRIAERLRDASLTNGRVGYELEAAIAIDYPAIFRFAVVLQRYCRIDWLLSALLARRFRLLFEWQIILQELAKFASWRVDELLGDDVARNMHGLIEGRLAQVQAALASLESQYPTYADSLRQGFVARAALRWEQGRYNRFLREAIIGSDLHKSLFSDIEQQIAQTYQPPKIDPGLSRRALTETVPFFKQLDFKDRRLIERIVQVQAALPGDIILERGERPNGMYFIASGALEMTGDETHQRLGTGDFFGEQSILSPTSRRRTRVIATGFCHLLIIKRDDFRKLIRKRPHLLEAMQKATKAHANERPGDLDPH